MVIGKIKPTATIVAQFAAGVEVETIQHEGKMFLPVVGMGDFSAKDTPSKSTEAPASEEKPSPKKSSGSSKKNYTEDELKDIDSKELVKILKNDFGIDPDDYDGKNTNKKLRDLILNAQNGDLDKGEGDEDENEKPESEEADDLTDKVAEILEDFDAGKKNKKKTISAIVSLVDGDVDEDKVTECVEEFEEDGDADLDETANEIAKILSSPKKESKKKESGKRSSKKENLVSVDDLEVGDRVSVWWDDDNQEWFDGEVKSKKKGKVVIAYDDDTEEAIDPEVHTKIKKLAE